MRSRGHAASYREEDRRIEVRRRMEIAEGILVTAGWTVLRRHSSGGQEIFASSVRRRGGLAWFCRIHARTATLFAGDIDHAIDRHLGKTRPDDAACEFVAMADRHEKGESV